MKAAQNFKVGDKVYAVKNRSWGLKPMKVVQTGESSVICKHPDFSSEELFYKNDIKLFSVERQSKLNKLNSLFKEIEMEKDKLFGA